MKKIICYLFIILPCIIYAQDSTGIDTTTNLNLSNTSKNDTIINLNALNNGIIKYQVSGDSKKVLEKNGLEIKEGGIIVVATDSLLKKDFSFDVKTFASDHEWYENTIKIQVNSNTITLINVTSDKIEMATGFRAEGKIYVVIGVSVILFFVIIMYLIYTERKVKKLENLLKGK